MPSSTLSVRAAIELVDRALTLGQRHFWILERLALIPVLAAVGIGYWYGGVGHPFLVRAGAFVTTAALYGIMEAVTIAGAWDLLHGQPVDVAATWRLIGGRSPSIVVVYVLKLVLIYLGVVALVLPGFYFLAIYFAVPAVNVLEGLGVGRSLVRSRALALGSLLGIVVSIGGTWVATVVVATLLPTLLTRLGVPPVSPLRFIVAVAWVGLVIPFRSALSALVYLELRMRREGYDLQRLLSSMPSAA